MVQQKTLQEIRKTKIKKLKELRKRGINPYPARWQLGGGRWEARDEIGTARGGKSGEKTAIAGRITGWRAHGGSVFADLRDESGQIQLWFQEQNLSGGFEILKLLDIGDFIGVSGRLTRTKAGEVSIDVERFEILTKSLRPLPSKRYGLKDVEERYRQRYLDLFLNEDLKDLFRKKAKFWQSVREFLVKKGFLEVETPVLENTAGGADANPFVTHHQVLDIDLYLRISMGELWQKRLMAAGFEKTFEIGRQFRNEGMSREHLQDYTQMEFYWAYADYEAAMLLVEEMYKFTAKETFGILEFEIEGQKINLAGSWQRLDYVKTIREKIGFDVAAASLADLQRQLEKLKIVYQKNESRGRLIDLLWKFVRKSIAGPAFLTGHPVEVSPLAKRSEQNPRTTERFQVIIAGSELGNGYSELNDPIDQAERFKEQEKMREKGDLEAQMNDRDFIRALEYGMPPTTGFGVSERLFAFLADKPIRETVLFPLLKPKK